MKTQLTTTANALRCRGIHIPALALGIAIGVLSSSALAKPADGKEKGDRPRGGDPAEVAAKMITEFDKNKDSRLQEVELAAAMTAQREQRGGDGAKRPGPEGKAGQRQGGPRQAGQAGQRQRGGPKAGQRDAGKGGAGQRGAGQRKRGAGQNGAGGRGPGMRQGMPGQAGGQSKIAARMITEFDKDGDKALNVDELTASVQAQRERRGGEAGDREGKGKRGEAGNRPGKGAGGKKRQGDNAEIGEGVTPKKPKA